MQQIYSRMKLIFPASQLEVLEKILEYMQNKHQGQLRLSGEPYITHPIAVANILLDLGMDYQTVGASLLHDCIEDTSATESEVASLFGEKICQLVDGVTKLDKITFTSQEEEQAENFRKMYIAMAKDIKVLLIKLADRLHNMRTINGLLPERRIIMARETIEIYAPLASRLGLSYIKCELEDLCLKVLSPKMYDDLVEQVALKRTERTELVNKITAELMTMLFKLGINGEVSGRPKHFYSIYKKMIDKHRAFEQIYDLTAMRVIVPEIADCYEILGMIHTVWKPIPGRFKDYIAVPKENNYRSLHTTVMTKFGIPFEIQIRTFEMHHVAEYGIAAHWKYKENISDNSDDAQYQWLRGVISDNAESNTSQDFYESLKTDLYSGQVFIFTPKGDVVRLPEGATCVDFAYSLHSEIGNKCVGAKVNSRITSLEAPLHTGDYVEIMTSPNSKGPSRDWLRFVKSSQAKSKIKSFFKKEMKEDNIVKGKQLLEDEAKKQGYNIVDLLNQKWLKIIMDRYSLSGIDDMYASIGYGGFTVNQVLLKLIDFYKKEHPSAAGIEQNYKHRTNNNPSGIIIKGHDNLLVRLARCCNPVPGDEIIGYISFGRGIAVHRSNCTNLKNVEKHRLIEAEWQSEISQSFVVELQIEAHDNSGLLANITMCISELKMSIININARLDKSDKAIINICVRINSKSELAKLQYELERLPNVENVFRRKS